MMKVLVKKTRACFVDFYYEVEIDDSTEPQYYDEAVIEGYYEGDYDYLGSAIQDTLHFYDNEFEVVDSLPCTLETINE